MNLRFHFLTTAIALGILGLVIHSEADDQPADKPAAQSTAPSIESKYLHNIRQLTSNFAKAGEGYFSPDGKTIIFQAVPTEYMFYQIYTLPLEEGGPQVAGSRQ